MFWAKLLEQCESWCTIMAKMFEHFPFLYQIMGGGKDQGQRECA